MRAFAASSDGGTLAEIGLVRGRVPGGPAGLSPGRTSKLGGPGGSRAPFRILADHEGSRNPSDWRLFEEWLHVFKGRRTLEWSRGLRARPLAHEQERTDEEMADGADPPEEIAVLEAEAWMEVVRRGVNLAVLAAVEA
jgi:hypothetical protein